MTRLVGEDFGRLFTTFANSAFRLETLDWYTVDDEAEPLRAFLAGRPIGGTWMSTWLEMIRESTDEGRKFTRVRLMREPPNDYMRFTLYCSQFNQTAGEDIRFLNMDFARRLGLPSYDFWLFDGDRVGRLHFTQNGKFLGAEIFTDLQTVTAHRRYQKIALEHATPYSEYLEYYRLKRAS